jgi:hypothetical protein
MSSTSHERERLLSAQEGGPSMRPILFAVAMVAAASVLAGADANAQSSICPAASTGRPVGSGARTLIPLPDRALLVPPAEFNCESNASRDETVKAFDRWIARTRDQPSESPAQADPGAALRAKLDYERQCYQHAEKTLRGRLLELQASTREMVKAVATCAAASTGSSPRSDARTSIPLPDQPLLVSPAEFNCEFNATSRDETVKAGTHDQPSESPTPAQADPDAALRAKLDYERQCYKRAEKVLRGSLLELQALVGATVKAVNRGEPPAVHQQRPGDPKLARALQAGGFVIVHRYTGRMPGSSPPAAAETIDAGQRISPQGRADAQAMGEVYRRLKIPVSQVLSSEFFVVYQTATAAFGNRVALRRDLTGSRHFNDHAELAQSLSGLRSRVATPPAAGTNIVLWTHEGKFKKAFGHSLLPGETVVFAPRNDGVPHEVVRLSLKEFLALAD